MQTSPTSTKPTKARPKRQKHIKPPVRVFNRLLVIIQQYEEKTRTKFAPTKDWYKQMGIGRKRWGFLVRNEEELKAGEEEVLALFFGVSVSDIRVQTLPKRKQDSEQNPSKPDDFPFYTRKEVMTYLHIGETLYAEYVKKGTLIQYKLNEDGRKIFHRKEEVHNQFTKIRPA